MVAASSSDAISAALRRLVGRRPDLSPLFADLSGLPPLLVQAGEAEVLFEHVCDFAARARQAGADLRLSAYPDMAHVLESPQESAGSR